MTNFQKIALTALRVLMGWFFFYTGITKLLDPAFSAEGYIKGAQTASFLYQSLLNPTVLVVVNFLVSWGLTLLGVSLILGFLVRVSSPLGALLMILFYLPILNFPYPNPHAFIVDEHIIYIAALAVLWSFDAGKIWGLDERWGKIFKK